MWTPEGYRNIEDIQPGERVYSRDQWNAGGEIAAKIVEEVFTRYAGIWELVAGGQTIRTTMEHPFFVVGKGWTVAHELQANDKLLCADGTTVSVEAVRDTGEWEVVYNLRVAEWHTYFVGGEEWGWAAWAHNAYLKTVERVQFASSTSIIAVSIQHRQDMDVTPGRNVAVAKVILPNNSVEYWSAQSGGDRVRRYAVVSGQVAFVGQIAGINAELAQMTSLASGAEYSNLHSEEVLLAGLNHYGRTPNHSLRLTDFYTEYAPCGCLQGSHQCSSRLHRWSLATNPNAWRRPDTVRVDTSVVKYSQFYPDSSAGRTTHRRFHMAISRAVAGENLTRADTLGEHYFQHQQISSLPLQHAIRVIRSIGNGINFPLPL